MIRVRDTAMARIQAGSALAAFGMGLTVPFLYVYAAQVRGLGSGAAGMVLAAFAAAALMVLPVTGRAIDRRGPLPVLLAAAVVSAAGAAALGLARGEAAVVLAAAVLGAGTAVMQPALATLVVWCSGAASRGRAFAVQFFLQNVGLGAGGLLGGLLVGGGRSGSYLALFGVEAAMFLALAGIAAGARSRIPAVAGEPAARSSALRGLGAGDGSGGWRGLLRHRAMMQLSVLGFVLFFACYGQFDSGLAAYGVDAAGVSPSMLGVALAANTAAIAVAQFAVLRFVERRRRSRVIAAVGLIWAVAWTAAGYAGLGHAGHAMATTAFVSTYALFGLGESLLSPTLAPLVADLAPEGAAGRYNSAFALVKQLALAVGPAVGGPMAATLHGPYIATFLVFSLGVTALALRLGRALGPGQDRPHPAGSLVVARGERREREPAGSAESIPVES